MLPLQFILLLIVVSLPDQIAMAQRAESGVAAAVIPPNFTWALLASLSLLLSQGFPGFRQFLFQTGHFGGHLRGRR